MHAQPGARNTPFALGTTARLARLRSTARATRSGRVSFWLSRCQKSPGVMAVEPSAIVSFMTASAAPTNRLGCRSGKTSPLSRNSRRPSASTRRQLISGTKHHGLACRRAGASSPKSAWRRGARFTSVSPTAASHSSRRLWPASSFHADIAATARRGARTGRVGSIASAIACTSPDSSASGSRSSKAAHSRLARTRPMPAVECARKSIIILPVGKARTARVATICGPHFEASRSPSKVQLSPIAGSPIRAERFIFTRIGVPARE